MTKRLQAKDIPDSAVLYAIAQNGGRWTTHHRAEGPRSFFPYPDPNFVCDTVPALGWFPEKVLRAKLASMARRGLIDGCACGCRGDWHIPERT